MELTFEVLIETIKWVVLAILKMSVTFLLLALAIEGIKFTIRRIRC